MPDVMTKEDVVLTKLMEASVDGCICWHASVKYDEFYALLYDKWRITVGRNEKRDYWMEIADKGSGRILLLKWVSYEETHCEQLSHPVKRIFEAASQSRWRNVRTVAQNSKATPANPT